MLKKGRQRLEEHVWNERQNILWDEATIVEKKTKVEQRKFEEAPFIATHNKCTGQDSFVS